MSVYLGIDIGTSGTKTLAINAKGKILADAMETLLLDRDYAQKLGRQGRDAVLERFSIEQTAEHLVHLYERITS